MVGLQETLAATGDVLRAQLAQARALADHAGTKGTVLEEAVMAALTAHLPEKFGLTSGQVADSDGRISGQCDIIVYDRLATPMLGVAPAGRTSLVPAEGVVAVVEVKTNLQPSGLEQIVEHMKKVKALKKKAYHQLPMNYGYNVFGEQRAVAPIMYTVFAYEGPKALTTIATALGNLQDEQPLDSRVDCLCFLEPAGTLLNVLLGPPQGLLRALGQLGSGTSSATSNAAGLLGPEVTAAGAFPMPNSHLMAAIVKNPVLTWVLSVISQISVFQTPPIDLRAYVQGNL